MGDFRIERRGIMERNKEMFRYAYTQSPYYHSLLDEKNMSINDLMEDWSKIETLVVVEHVAELILAQHAVVDKDTGEILADGAVEKHGGYR